MNFCRGLDRHLIQVFFSFTRLDEYHQFLSTHSVEEKGFATDRFVLKAGEVLFLSSF